MSPLISAVLESIQAKSKTMAAIGRRGAVLESDGEKIAETLARLGIASTGPPQRRQSSGELDYVYDV